MKIAVITHPRSGSRSYATFLAQIGYGESVGSINFAESVASNRLSDEEIMSGRFVLHGHWHTIEKHSPAVKDYIASNYAIHHIERPELHRWLSSMIVMSTGQVDPPYIPMSIDTALVDEYFTRMAPATVAFTKWEIAEFWQFDDFYPGQSLLNYERNCRMIVNCDELHDAFYAKRDGMNNERI